MNKEKKLKYVKKLWDLSNSSTVNEDVKYDIDLEILDLCTEYDFINEYVLMLDSSVNIHYE